MYNFHIEEMISKLIGKNIIQEINQQEAIETLQNYWDGKIAIVWSAQDIMNRAEDNDIDITEEQAKDILNSILEKHDCEQGITWDTIDLAIQEYSN